MKQWFNLCIVKMKGREKNEDQKEMRAEKNILR